MGIRPNAACGVPRDDVSGPIGKAAADRFEIELAKMLAAAPSPFHYKVSVSESAGDARTGELEKFGVALFPHCMKPIDQRKDSVRIQTRGIHREKYFTASQDETELTFRARHDSFGRRSPYFAPSRVMTTSYEVVLPSSRGGNYKGFKQFPPILGHEGIQLPLDLRECTTEELARPYEDATPAPAPAPAAARLQD